jgi:hypothetical protein
MPVTAAHRPAHDGAGALVQRSDDFVPWNLDSRLSQRTLPRGAPYVLANPPRVQINKSNYPPVAEAMLDGAMVP